jgi:hypothetical protein
LRSLLVASLWLAAAGAVQARTPFQVRCEDTIGKTVSVLSSQQNGYRIDHTRSYRTLSQMKAGARGSVVLGLTRTESRVSIGVGGPMLFDKASGFECVAPRIDVDVHYLPIIIYIGSEIPAGSCAYREVLAHELRHLKAYQEHLPKVESKVRTALATGPCMRLAGRRATCCSAKSIRSGCRISRRKWRKLKSYRRASILRRSMRASAKFAVVRYSHCLVRRVKSAFEFHLEQQPCKQLLPVTSP